MNGLSLRVLGPVEVWRSGQPVPAGGHKARVVLAVLLAHHGDVVSTDRLCDALWGDDPPPSALATLQSHVSRLRRFLEPEATIAARPPGYSLRAGEGVVDSNAFEAAIAGLSGLELEPRVEQLQDALALWRGSAFEGLADLEWSRGEAVRLEELRLGAIEELIEGRLALGRENQVVGELERLVIEHPFRERFWRQLVLALYRAGRQAESLRRGNDMRTLLREELGLEPSAQFRELEARILADDPALLLAGRVANPHAARRASAHEATRFVGRQADIDGIDDLLRREPIVTLVGPGGVGKTRLASRCGELLTAEFRDGVALVELADIRDGVSIADAVATSLDIQQRQHLSVEESVLELLRESEMLIIFDNCEHVVDGVAPLVARVRASCPGVSVLATSREPMGVAGECVWSVEPLDLPGVEGTDMHQVAATPAVQLFVDRAVSALPSFALTESNVEAVAEICRRLDGLPLALELAAPRLRMMGPEVLAERLDQRFALLAGDRGATDTRHRTLRAVVDWSHDLLDPEEQALFARLSTFAAGFDLAAVEAVCAPDSARFPAVVGVLAKLVDRSMVQVVDRDEPRYRLLETLRDYAREQLELRGEVEETIARHIAWFAAVAKEGERGLTGPDEEYWLARLDRDLANFREAHAHALRSGDIAAASELVVALREFAFCRIRYEVTSWAAATAEADGFETGAQAPLVLAVGAYGGFVRGDLELAIDWGHRAVALAERLGTDTSGLAERALGNALFYRGDSDEAIEWMERMLQAARESGSSSRLAHALYMRSVAFTSTGDPIRGAVTAGEARVFADQSGSPTALAQVLYALGLSLELSDPEEADRVLRRSAALGGESGNRWIEAFALTEVHALAARRGETAAALQGFAGVIRSWYRGGDWANQWLSLRHVCGALSATGAIRAAAVLHGALSAAGAAYALPGTPDDTTKFERLGVELRTQLGAAEYANAVREGVGMRDSEIVAFVLDEIERAA